jgi:hypothetical protein
MHLCIYTRELSIDQFGKTLILAGSRNFPTLCVAPVVTFAIFNFNSIQNSKKIEYSLIHTHTRFSRTNGERGAWSLSVNCVQQIGITYL